MAKVTDTRDVLPAWVVGLGSVAIACHLLAVVIVVLAAPSGPWPTDGGSTLSTPPQFAYSLNNLAPSKYLQSLGMMNHYHFFSNRPAVPGVSFEVRLKDESGKVFSTVRFPEAGASFSVRHRQSLLARSLADDQPIEPPQGEVIPAANRSVPTAQIWETRAAQELILMTVPEHLIPRDRPVSRPSEQSLLLARSYARYLCRRHGATRAEVIRHTQEPIPPAVMFIAGPPLADAAGKLISNFGEPTE
ncbi:MAG: hypothetical protein H6823_03930 [Planctomycetaceae bacterium]|nr:hypothetical protein [Planctomycetaceae bacterium]